MKLLMIRVIVFFTIFICAVNVSAQKTDVIVMKNGDRLTCEIKSLEGGVLYVSLDYVDGTIALEWSKVARLESTRLFIVKTESGEVYEGTLSTAETSADQIVRIEVAQTEEKKKIELESKKVVTIGTTSEKLWKRFNGDIGVGMSYAKGNQSTQYNLNSSIEYPRERWSAEALFNSNFSSSTGSDASTRNQLDFRVKRLLRWNNFFYTGAISFLESSEQNIKRQTNLGGGIGYYFKNTNRARISLTGGIGWQHTRYNGAGSEGDTQNAAAGIFTFQMRLFKFKKSKLNLDAVLAPSITEPGRVYFRTNQSFYVKLFNDLSWNVSFYGNWDSRPPNGLSGSDYGTSTGLGWSFGNK